MRLLRSHTDDEYEYIYLKRERYFLCEQAILFGIRFQGSHTDDAHEALYYNRELYYFKRACEIIWNTTLMSHTVDFD